MASTSGTHMLSLQNPILSGNNYEYWSLKMKALFRGKDVWEIVQNGYIEPRDQTEYNTLTQVEKDDMRELRKKDRNAMFYIHQVMHESILPRVVAAITAKQELDTLETSYKGLYKVKTSKLQILEEILNLCE